MFPYPHLAGTGPAPTLEVCTNSTICRLLWQEPYYNKEAQTSRILPFRSSTTLQSVC